MKKLTLLTISTICVSSAYAQNSQMISSGSQFNPSISLILDGNYYHDNKKGKAGDYLEEIAGISHTVHDEHAHDAHGVEQGFNLGESELVMSATVDPYFDGKLILAIDGVGTTELEEHGFKPVCYLLALKSKWVNF
jgi:hypothetical protein